MQASELPFLVDPEMAFPCLSRPKSEINFIYFGRLKDDGERFDENQKNGNFPAQCADEARGKVFLVFALVRRDITKLFPLID